MPTLPTASELPPSYLYEYTGSKLIGVAIAFIILDIVFVGLRFYSKWMHKNKTGIGADDVLVPPALIFCLALDGLGIAMTKYGGAGRHLLALEVTDPIQVVNWAKFLVAANWIYLAAVTLPKLSILSMYLRIFTTRVYRRSVYVLAVVLIMNFLAGGLSGTLGCQPLAFFWDRTIPGGYCINTNAYYRWISFPNILTDIIMLVLPQPAIWTLMITRNQKIGLTLTFLTGSVGLIASIFRFTSFFRNDGTTDGTFLSVELMSWTIVEPGTYLIAACLPILRSLVQRVFQNTSLAHASTEWTPKYGGRSHNHCTANIHLEGRGGLRSEAHAPGPGFHRLADDKKSIGNSSED